MWHTVICVDAERLMGSTDKMHKRPTTPRVVIALFLVCVWLQLPTEILVWNNATFTDLKGWRGRGGGQWLFAPSFNDSKVARGRTIWSNETWGYISQSERGRQICKRSRRCMTYLSQNNCLKLQWSHFIILRNRFSLGWSSG